MATQGRGFDYHALQPPSSLFFSWILLIIRRHQPLNAATVAPNPIYCLDRLGPISVCIPGKTHLRPVCTRMKYSMLIIVLF